MMLWMALCVIVGLCVIVQWCACVPNVDGLQAMLLGPEIERFMKEGFAIVELAPLVSYPRNQSDKQE